MNVSWNIPLKKIIIFVFVMMVLLMFGCQGSTPDPKPTTTTAVQLVPTEPLPSIPTVDPAIQHLSGIYRFHPDFGDENFDYILILNQDGTAELDRHVDGVKNRSNRVAIDCASGKGAVEIDDVQPFEAVGGEGARLGCRVGVEYGCPLHVALFEANALAVFEIDGGKQDHGFHFRKLAIRAKPRRWLFSGWNWVPATLPRATIAVISPP